VCFSFQGRGEGGSSRLLQEKQRLIKPFPTHPHRTGPSASLGRVEMESIFTRLVFCATVLILLFGNRLYWLFKSHTDTPLDKIMWILIVGILR
jgi:hypothetical protein